MIAGTTNDLRRMFSVPRRVGRPIGANPESDQSLKPWLAEGVSRRTWYRRKAEESSAAPEPPQQHASHVAARYAQLGSMARLDYRAQLRRDHRAIALQAAHSATSGSDLIRSYMRALGVN